MRLLFVSLCLAITLGLTGCDQVRQRIADTLAPASPAEMASRMDALVENNKSEEAVEQGRDYLKFHKDPEGLVKQALSRAHVAAGMAVSTAKTNTSSSDISSASSPPSSKNDPMGHLVQESSSKVAVEGASVVSGPGGTVVRAGDAVVIMPKQ